MIIVFLIIPFLFDLVVETLNIRAISDNIPAEFKQIYKPKAYKKSQRYLKTSTKFGLFQSGIQLGLLILFIFLGGFNLVDIVARHFAQSEIARGLIFIGILLILNNVISLPFSYYETFVIEQKFGFNKTTLKTFLKDLVMGLILTTILGGIVFSIVIGLFLTFGDMAWIMAWVFVSIFQLFILFIAPVVIMPLFNKFTALEQIKLKSEIEKFAKRQNFAIKGVYTMDGSKRSTKSNAFFTGLGRFRRIVLFDTLIKKHTVNELVSILAHEIGHYKKKHILKQIGLSAILMGISLFVFSRLINNHFIFSLFRMNNVSIYASLIFVFILISPVFEIVSILMNLLSRKFEFEADEYAISSFRHKTDFVNALKKLSVNNLSNLTPHPLKVIKDYSHPPIMERIENIKKLG